MQTIKKIIQLFNRQEKIRAVQLMSLIVVMAILDMIGVASIMPFIAVLASPELVETNKILYLAYTKIGFTDKQQFLFALGVVVFLLLVFSLAFKALTTYAQLRFTMMREYTIGKRLVEGYLNQPYSWFLSRHSSDLGKTILSDVGIVIGNGVMPMMSLISQCAVIIALLSLLIFIDPKLSLFVGLTLATAYTLIFKISRGFLASIGQEVVKANQSRFAVVSEAFDAAKEVKVGGLEQAYIKRFSVPAEIYAQHLASEQVIRTLPRFALEAIAFGGMMMVVLYLMAQSDSLASVLPSIALYALAGYRLMPALQQIYGAATQLRFVGPAVDALHGELNNLQSAHSCPVHDALILQKVITLNHVVYTYPNAPHPTIKNLTLSISARSTVGLVGTTGSGKTTTVDLILGLLLAQKGTLEVDGQPISEHNRRSWQRTIGYVPQQIFLADDTVAANIAFGLEAKDIDQYSVERAAKIANLHDFVKNELPHQYNTTVGERGVRLSGGQRQRIGIARALYHKPQVLILDEATSALDNLTEQVVMEAVQNLGHEITIILIAHRLSTVKDCDQIFLLDKGEIKAQGTFVELTQSSERFRTLASGY